MNRTVFLAYPLSTVRVAPDVLEGFVNELSEAFHKRAWDVLPQQSGSARIAAAAQGHSPALLRSNIDAVTGSQLLVVLAAASREPSSIWVEAGMAVALSIPLVVVSVDPTAMPYLIRLAVLADPHASPGIHVQARLPPRPAQRPRVIEAVLDAATEAFDRHRGLLGPSEG